MTRRWSRDQTVMWLLGIGSGDINAPSLSHDIARPNDQRIMLLYGWKSLIASHHPAKFGGHVILVVVI